MAKLDESRTQILQRVAHPLPGTHLGVDLVDFSQEFLARKIQPLHHIIEPVLEKGLYNVLEAAQMLYGLDIHPLLLFFSTRFFTHCKLLLEILHPRLELFKLLLAANVKVVQPLPHRL